MLRLINAELYILFKSRVFKILCVVAIVLALVLVGVSKLVSSEDFIKSSLKGMSPQQQEQFIEQLQSLNGENASVVQPGGMGFHISSKDLFQPTSKEIFHSSFGAGAVEILMAVLIGAMVASEYSLGTIKNILAYGKKREYYYISKLIAISVGLVIILGIMVTLSTVICSFIFGWGEPFDFAQLSHILKVFASAVIVGIAIISLLMFLATLLKSNGSTIVTGIVLFAILPTIVSFLYGKYTWFDKIFEATPSYNWALATAIRANNADLLKTVIISLITILIATVGGIMIFKKQDIK